MFFPPAKLPPAKLPSMFLYIIIFNTVWLRWATPEGEFLPTVDELSAPRAEKAQRQAEQAQ